MSVTSPSLNVRQDVRVDWQGLLYPHPLPWVLSVALIAFNAVWLLISTRLTLDVMAYIASPANLGLLLALVLPMAWPNLALNTPYRCVVGGLGLLFLYLNLRIFNHVWFSIPATWADDQLIAWSDVMGLKWLDYAEGVLAYPTLAAAIKFCYSKVEVPMAILFLVLCVVRKHRVQSGFVISVALTATVCTVISAFFPAKSAVATHATEALSRTLAASATYQIELISALQSSQLHTLHPNNLPGLSTFPSFHTALGVLMIYWSWRADRVIGMACSVYAVLMIAATPIYGGHYFIDLIFGALIAYAISVLAYRILDNATLGFIRPAA
jgi:PAP2 superfamily